MRNRDCGGRRSASCLDGFHAGRRAHHSTPLPVFEVLVSGPADALRAMQTEQAVVELPDNILRAQEVIERPLFPERAHIRPKDRRRVWTEVTRLIHGDEHVLKLERLELEVAGLRLVSERRGVEGVFRVPGN